MGNANHLFQACFALFLCLVLCPSATANDSGKLAALIADHDLSAIADSIEESLSAEEVRPVVQKVRAHLASRGLEIGPSDPHVLIVGLHDGNRSEVAYGVILIGARQPEGCRTRLIAHEATHFFLGRDHGRSSRDPEVESLANAMERLVAPEYLPNCGDRQ